MAANQFDLNYRTVALTGTTVRTVAGFKTAANVAGKVLEASISFDGATSTAAPAVVDFNRCDLSSNFTIGTANTTATLAKRDPGRAETLQTTGATAWTSEPTVLTTQHSKDIAQYMGVYHYIHPFASPLIIPGGKGFTITVTPSASVNASGHIAGEE